MARYVTASDKIIRTRWSAFLREYVDDDTPGQLRGYSISDTALAAAINKVAYRRGDARWQIHDWLEGETTVKPQTASNTGEALRDLGVTWSNAPVALYAAGHTAAVIAFLAQLAECGKLGPSVALDLYAALPLAVEVEVDALLGGSRLTLELEGFKAANMRELPVHQARAFIASSFARLSLEALETFNNAAHRRPDPMRGVHSVAAREAYRIACSPISPALARDAAWLVLKEWEGEFLDSCPPPQREQLEAAYEEWREQFRVWRRATTTTMDDARERRQEATRDARRTPEQQASLDRFIDRAKAEEKKVNTAAASESPRKTARRTAS